MNDKFKKLSFWQLLDICYIEIPIIQRDYAQGRAKEKKIRNLFLSSLKKALTEKPVELDFIYGSEENSVLQPLDGQQRLTTLFLLHWYIAKKEEKIDNDVKARLSKFTYEIRTSSREFCKELINAETEICDNETISDSIKKKTIWFVDSWEKDSTISSMLTMLDAIQEKYKDISNLWEKLILEECPITFLYLKLENFGLSDDLYIKMNARGKQLTPFEIFKSRFEKYIEDNKWEEEIKDKKPQYTFAHKIDTEWTNLFWKYKNKIEKKDEKGNSIVNYYIDEHLINFIAGIAIICYSEAKENVVKIGYLANNAKEVTPEDFFTEMAFNYLKNCLNKYAEETDGKFSNAGLKTKVSLWNYCSSSLFEDFCKFTSPQYKPRALFYAQTIYLLNNDVFNENLFEDWMRVIRNIVENSSSIDSSESFIGVIALIKELSNGCMKIYDYLATNTIQSGFAHEQTKEEIIKAKIIIKNPEIKEIILEIEDTDFCKGSVNWCLNCTDTDNTVELLNKLKKIRNIIKEHLYDNKISSLFRRALLTIGDNCFYNYWNGNNQFKSPNTNTYKRYLIQDRNELKTYFIKGYWFDNYFKHLIIQLITKDMQSIIDDYDCSTKDMLNWKKRLIKEDLLKDRCFLGITYEDRNKCYLFPSRYPKTIEQCELIE